MGPSGTARCFSGPSRNELDALEHWGDFQRQDASEGSQTPNATRFCYSMYTTFGEEANDMDEEAGVAWGREVRRWTTEKREQEFGLRRLPK